MMETTSSETAAKSLSFVGAAKASRGKAIGGSALRGGSREKTSDGQEKTSLRRERLGRLVRLASDNVGGARSSAREVADQGDHEEHDEQEEQHLGDLIRHSGH